MNKEFDLTHQFELYLERVGLKGKYMPEVQYTETKRAFFGACGQMLILLRNEVGKLSEDDAMVIFENLLKQIGEFWNKQTNKQN